MATYEATIKQLNIWAREETERLNNAKVDLKRLEKSVADYQTEVGRLQALLLEIEKAKRLVMAAADPTPAEDDLLEEF